jgi:two-component system, OmpR family, sensor histidine kinase QseC
MKQEAWSLRNRLIVLLGGLAFIAWGASSLWLYRTAEKQAGELFDAALVEAANAVFAAVAHEGLGKDDDFEFEPEEHAHDERLVYQLLDRRGSIVYFSPRAPREALAAAEARGFSERVADGIAYRVYTLRASNKRAAIHVGQRLSDRAAMVRTMVLQLLLPGVVVVLLLAVGVWFIVRRVTLPVISFSHAIDARAPADSGPVVVDSLPRELQPVGRAVNGLLERVEIALVRERTLTADAAHELRTPLAALRAQAQVALRSREDTERSEALQALIGGVDRATRLVETVLTLARLDARSIDRTTLPVVSLRSMAGEVVAGLSAAARARGLQLEMDVPELAVRADSDSLPVALRNLCDNAIRHATSRVQLEARVAARGVVITVRDDGPGMTAEQQSRAFDRFYRGTSDSAGAGLGLALVKRVTDLHGGSVRFSAGLNGRGLGVEIVLPDAAVNP